jgi:flagellar motor switch protein FliG
MGSKRKKTISLITVAVMVMSMSSCLWAEAITDLTNTQHDTNHSVYRGEPLRRVDMVQLPLSRTESPVPEAQTFAEGEYHPQLPIHTRPLPNGIDPQQYVATVDPEALRQAIAEFERLIGEGKYAEAAEKFLSLINSVSPITGEDGLELGIAILNNLKSTTAAYLISALSDLSMADAGYILSCLSPETAAQILTAGLSQIGPQYPTGGFAPNPARTIISAQKAAQILGAMSGEAAGNVLVYISQTTPELLVSIIDNLGGFMGQPTVMAFILTNLSAKDAALILSHLDTETIAAILSAEPRWVVPNGPLVNAENAAAILKCLASLGVDTGKLANIISAMQPCHSAPIIKALINAGNTDFAIGILRLIPLDSKIGVADILAYDQETKTGEGPGLTVDECVQLLQGLDGTMAQAILSSLDTLNPGKAAQIRERLG